jgi:hypothetical protein
LLQDTRVGSYRSFSILDFLNTRLPRLHEPGKNIEQLPTFRMSLLNTRKGEGIRRFHWKRRDEPELEQRSRARGNHSSNLTNNHDDLTAVSSVLDHENFVRAAQHALISMTRRKDNNYESTQTR